MADGLGSNNVYDLHFDHTGRLIIATDRGLNMFNGNKIYSYNQYRDFSYLRFFYFDSSLNCISYKNEIININTNDSLTLPLKNSSFGINPNLGRLGAIIKDKDTITYSNDYEIYSVIDNKLDSIYSSKTKINNDFPAPIMVLYKPGVSGFHPIRFQKTSNAFPANYAFFEFELNPAIPTNVSSSLFASNNYFAYHKEIKCSDGRTWKLNTAMSSSFISSIHASKSEILVGTNEGDLISINTNNNSQSIIFSTSRVITAIRKKKETIWISTEGEGIYRLYSDIQSINPRIDFNVNDIFFADDHIYYPKSGSLFELENMQLVAKFLPQEITIAQKSNFNKNISNNKKSHYPPMYALKTAQGYISTYYAGLHKLYVNPNRVKGMLISRYDEKFRSAALIDSQTCLLGSVNGLYTYDYTINTDYSQEEVFEDQSFNSLNIPLLNGIRVNSICRIKGGKYLIGTHGKGLFILDLPTLKARTLNSLGIFYALNMLKIDSTHYLVNSGKALTLLSIKDNMEVNKKSSWQFPSINRIRQHDGKIYLATGKGIFNLEIKSILDQRGAKLSSTVLNQKYNWKSKNKTINWNCSVLDAGNNEPTYQVTIVNNSDTQVFYTSDNFYNLSTLTSGTYESYITLNPKLGQKSNILRLETEILPPWYLAMKFKIVYAVLLILLTLLLLNRIAKFYKRRYQLQLEQTNLKLAAVRNILNPHYLNNTLNSLQAIAFKKDFEKLNAYITKLSQWLRLSLKENDHQLISLEKELLLIGSFLDLEKMKLEYGLQYLILNQTDTLDYQVPFFILQPIVENTLKYSYINSKKPKLTIQITKESRCLKIQIMDNGHGKPIHNKNSTGAGLAIIKRKLELYDQVANPKIKSSYSIRYIMNIGSISTIILQNPSSKKT